MIFLMTIVLILSSEINSYNYGINYHVSESIRLKETVDYYNRFYDSNGLRKKNSYIRYEDYLKPCKCQYSLEFTLIDSLEIPGEDYFLYNVHHDPSRVNCDKKIQVTTPIRAKKEYLVAYNPRNDRFLVVCGDLYKSRIANYFNLTNNKDLLDFLKLKLYFKKYKTITVINTSGDFITAKGIALDGKSDVISFSYVDPDRLKINDKEI